MCVTAQRWEHPLMSDMSCSPASSCTLPATNTRALQGDPPGSLALGRSQVEGLGSPATHPSASLFVMSLESAFPALLPTRSHGITEWLGLEGA